MTAIKIIFTLLLFGGMFFALMKKLNFAVSLMILGFAGIGVGIILNGTSPVGDATTGNLFFDIFEYFKSSAIIGVISGAGINFLSILAYVAYMNHLKAAKLFALLVAKPLSKIKNKYLIAWATYVFTALLLLVIPNGTGRIALLLGTLYPVMLACGLSKATAATAIFAGTMYQFGPTNNNVVLSAGYAGIADYNLAEHFVNIELPWFALSLVLGSIVYLLCAKYFDKKENAEFGVAEISNDEIKALGIPKYYAIFPLIPLFAIVLFSGLFKGLPKVSIPGVEWACFTLVFLWVIITSKDKIQAFNDGFEVFKSMGNTMTNILGIVIGSTVFGQAITQIGGVGLLLQPFVNAGANVNLILFIVIATLVGLIVGTISVSNYVVMSVFAPIYGAISASSGANISYLLMNLVNSSQFVMGFSPATAHVAMVSQHAGIEIPTVIKRAAIPLLSSVLVYVIGACIMA